MKVSFKWLLLVISILLVSVPIITMGIVSYQVSEKEAVIQLEHTLKEEGFIVKESIEHSFNLAQEKVNSDLSVAREAIHMNGDFRLDTTRTRTYFATNQVTKASKTIRAPAFYAGTTEIANNFEMVDHVRNMVGGFATVFQRVPEGYLRINTNVVENGARALGTYVPNDSPVTQAIDRGETFYGRAFVVDSWFMIAMEPIKDDMGNVIGAIGVGVEETFYQDDLLNELSEISIGKTGYIWILDKEGNYVLSLNRERDGENIINAKDDSGRYFVQEWIDKGPTLDKKEVVIDYYPWQNKDENSPRTKITGYTYFDEWDWIIGSSAYVDDFMGGVKIIRNTTILVVFLAILLSAAAAYFMSNYLSNIFKKFTSLMKEIEKGDLSKKLTLNIKVVELKELADSFNNSMSIISDTLSKVVFTTNEAAASAEELSASAEEVNASVEQVSSTVQEIAKSAQELSKNASGAASKSELTQTSATNGAKAANDISTHMSSISSTTQAGEQKVRQLGDKSKKIGEIVDTINGISEQTNLLALNAAIEAARAGDAGKGFAVVADEVRKLAEESQKATAQITQLIGGIQTEIDDSVSAMHENTSQVAIGTKSVDAALASFEEIPLLVNQVNKTITQISSISEENAAGAQEVSASVEEVTSAMQQVAVTSEKLASGANELKSLVSKFKLVK